MAQIEVNGKLYDHQFFTGEVVGAQKQLETKVTGGGGGGGSYQGTGYSAPVHISSTTTTHDMIHIRDDEGHEKAIRLQNWDLSVRESHRLTAIWLAKPGRKHHPYLAVHNHTLSQTDYNEGELDRMHRTIWILLGSFAVWLLPGIGAGTKFLLMVVGLITWWVLGVRGRRALIASGRLLQMAGV